MNCSSTFNISGPGGKKSGNRRAQLWVIESFTKVDARRDHDSNIDEAEGGKKQAGRLDRENLARGGGPSRWRLQWCIEQCLEWKRGHRGNMDGWGEGGAGVSAADKYTSIMCTV